MIGAKMQDAINKQIQEELYSSYLYLSMSAYFSAAGFDGMAQWMRVQSEEEKAHAMKFFGHIVERDGKVELFALDKPKAEWASPLEAFKAAYKHEQHITGKINELVDIAAAEKDNPAANLLQWYVNEQVEEEANASKIVQMLERIGDSSNGLFMLDQQLGKRE